MHKIKVVIIEDEFFAASHLGSLLASLNYEVTGTFYNGEDFFNKTDRNFDAAIVDILLSDSITGLDIAAKLNEWKKPFIFLTANQDSRTLKDAARLAPKAYISKPFHANDVQAALEIIALGMMPIISVRTPKGTEELSTGDIMFIRSDGVYIEIQTTTRKIIQRKLLKEIMEELPPEFIRVHRSYLVNTGFIDHRSASHLIVRGHSIPVSRNYKSGIDPD